MMSMSASPQGAQNPQGAQSPQGPQGKQSAQITKTLNLIAGEFVSSSDGVMVHRDPSTGEPSCELPDSGILDLVASIQSANKAWGNWQKTSPDERAQFLTRFANRMEERSDELALAQSLDIGTPLKVARTVSVPRAVSIVRSYARLLLQTTGISVVESQALFFTHRMPHGVVAIITPWSDPIVSLASKIAPALGAGNVVIAKPSEFSPRCAHLLAEIICEAGLPPGVLNLVHGRGETIGAAMIRHPGIGVISFTGSTDVGRQIARDSGEALKRLQLGLGARNPVLIFSGVDLDKVMPQIAQATLGLHPATCLRGSRIFVQENIHDEFLEKYRAFADGLRSGDPQDNQADLGPLAHEALLLRYRKAVEQALAEKGKLLTGGLDSPTHLAERHQGGFFVQPTIFYDLTLCSTLQQEEVIGPFVTISTFKYQHDAISKFANNSPLGQAAWVFESNLGKANRVASRLEAGRVFVNTGVPLMDERFSFGGLKNSGLGQEGGEESLRFFSREAVISQNIAP